MKINIQVEIDWIEEDGNIDTLVKEEIVAGVKEAISKDCLKSVEQKTQIVIDEGINDAISLMHDKVSDFFEDWVNNEVTITDKYGDSTDRGTLKEIIKKQFNDCMNENVDKNGITSNGFGSVCTRLEYVTGKKTKEIIDNYLSSYTREIDKTIKAQIEEGLKSRVSNKFAEMVIGYAKQDHKNIKTIEQT